MTTGRPGPFLVFAASEPVRGDEGYALAASFHRLRVFLQLPPQRPLEVVREPSGERRWAFPADVGRCVRVAVEVALSLGRTVHVVDVSRPADDRGLVERWVGPDTILPLLVASEGRRLQGIDAFVPSRLRAFFAAP